VTAVPAVANGREAAVDHSRWVAGEATDRLVISQDEVERARAQAQAQATAEAEAAALAQSRTAPDVEAVTEGSASPAAVEGGESLRVEGEFVPAPAFRGAHTGYVFKTGAQGLGYYREATAVPVRGGMEGQGGDGEGEENPPFRMQQVEKCFTLIVEVKNIDPASVEVDWAKAAATGQVGRQAHDELQ
jgi:hypothetical protein